MHSWRAEGAGLLGGGDKQQGERSFGESSTFKPPAATARLLHCPSPRPGFSPGPEAHIQGAGNHRAGGACLSFCPSAPFWCSQRRAAGGLDPVGLLATSEAALHTQETNLTPSRGQEEQGEGRSQEVGCTLLISLLTPWGTLASSSLHFPQIELVRVAGGKPCL